MIEAHVAESPGFDLADRTYFDAVLHGVLKDAPALRARFVPFIDRRVELLSPVEHAALLIGTFELVGQLEIPYRVVINEAVELANAYSGDKAGPFVNGVLGSIARSGKI